MAAIGVALPLPDGGDFPRGLTALFAQCQKHAAHLSYFLGWQEVARLDWVSLAREEMGEAALE
ncbi:MAG: hypothetical protein KIT52_09150 [Anaerolineae bacterium]|nr:hypothetical protein [Anaerolineae bacterium]